MLPHFFKQFLFWLCFCWRRRHQWHQRPPRCCDCVASFFQTCFFCLSAGGRGHYATGLQGAVLPHFFKQFLFWLCFCWRRRGWLKHLQRRLPRCCVAACLLTLSNNYFFVFLLEAEGTTPRAFKVLCCRISSNNSFFGCVSAGGGVTSGTSNCQGAVTALLHFF